MPGRVTGLTTQAAFGWALHSRLPDYRVVVNLAHHALVVRSTLAESPGGPQVPPHAAGLPCGFRIDLETLGLVDDDLGRLAFCIGETEERLELPAGLPAGRGGRMTVEDLLAEAHRPRPWVDGTTYLDAAAAGLQVETIVDLLYRDYLGRPSDPNGLAHYSAAIRAGSLTFDDVRRGFLQADEYRLRRKYLDTAPGTIFSQKIVAAAASADPAGGVALPPPVEQIVSASELTALDGEAFVSEVYRRILLKEVDEGGMAHYLNQLHIGVGKIDVIRTIASELEAITAGVRVIGIEPEPVGAPAQAAA